MNIVSALKAEASRLRQELSTVHAAIKALGGRNSFGRGRRKKWHMSASARARIARGAKSAVGEGEGREEEWMTAKAH